MKKEKAKKLTSEDVAEYFLALANEKGDQMTNLRLQKLIYYAQAWHLANFPKPLFEEDFEAWVHGPVIPKLYRKYKNGYNPITASVSREKVEARFTPRSLKLLEEVADVYMPLTASQLEKMTHQEAPWIQARRGLDPTENCSNVIDKTTIKRYYGERLNKKSKPNSS